MVSEIFCGKKRDWSKVVDVENIYSDDGVVLYIIPYLIMRKTNEGVGIYYRYMGSEEIIAEFKNKEEISDFTKTLEAMFDAI